MWGGMSSFVIIFTTEHISLQKHILPSSYTFSKLTTIEEASCLMNSNMFGGHFEVLSATIKVPLLTGKKSTIGQFKSTLECSNT